MNIPAAEHFRKLGLMQELTAAALGPILDELTAADAAVHRGQDDYGNPIVEIYRDSVHERPVLSRHSVIGGEEIVALTGTGESFKVPMPNADAFGAIDDASTQIAALWPHVVSRFPAAAI
ncbi:hypothetical protein [Mycobacteroides abscessus]|uniref:hypothetical protein n=1 Tax=Mycobacteroides abscessus TaxID=36809 RepID=UPI000C26BBAC|nr:hypothetical protein [Mycobacteroides abscessus]